MAMSEVIFRALAPSGPSAPAPRAAEPRDFLRHVAALTLTRLADALIDPKLVLPWLLSAAGAPAAFIGALAPVREAGALLPQIALAERVRRAPLRKRVWALGAAGQGAAALGIAAAGATLSGWPAGIAATLCLAALAVARAACSVSHKDALARTVGKTRRGAVTGVAATPGSAGALAFGALLWLGIVPQTQSALAGAAALAGLAWLAAAAVFLRLEEEPGAPAGPEDAGRGDAWPSLAPLLRPGDFRRFVAARGLLAATALGPPFLVMGAAALKGGGAEGALGPLVLASALAAALSSYVWGRAADRSSRRAMMAAGALGAAALGAGALITALQGAGAGPWAAAGALFALQLAHAGARVSRKVHLTDMTDEKQRARLVALANTAIGALLLLGGGVGLLAQLAGPAAALAALALMSAASVPVAAGLAEAQRG
ncbi:hypothetical protein LY05_01070 [Oceanicella actignis]|nr:hypothetical protein LY05_01070 [Oceanicella actignis]